ncbi:amidase [Virgisporangium aliadipatigenens]|uniref:Amidase n=1 Tax=Virgisporangium aliadipatigenens TaxID=741659 RepID=A0A8J3YH76_9ACTN|nr:amidase [Virgisporangium aliadipatigenens]GIJ45224.1 amidase [Virgisporangium aliadipatigenens]
MPWFSAVELSESIRRREISCVEVMTSYLERLDAHNPRVNAVVALRDPEELLREAADRDAALAAGERAGWLHGLPFAVKDLAAAAGLPWTEGSPIHARRVADEDEPFVKRIRDAGAIIIGKTNVPEFGLGSQTYNHVYGPTSTPYDTTRTAGGSSGGAAAALALRLLPVADGSDYLGSLRNPAAFCNVLGFRPTYGRIPSPGFVRHPSTVGPMGRTVEDVTALLEVMSGAALPPAAETGRRIAWVGDLGGHLATEPGLLEVCRRALDVFEELGFVVEEAVPDYPFDRLWNTVLTWRWWGMLGAHDELYADPATRARLKPEIVWEIENGLRLTALDIARAEAARTEWYDTALNFFSRYDFVLAPSTQVFPFPVTTPWPAEIAGRPMDSYHRWMETVAPWSMTGMPALGMPAGFDERGLPAGVQLVGRPGADAEVLRLARAYEERTNWVRDRPPPA